MGPFISAFVVLEQTELLGKPFGRLSLVEPPERKSPLSSPTSLVTSGLLCSPPGVWLALADREPIESFGWHWGSLAGGLAGLPELRCGRGRRLCFGQGKFLTLQVLLHKPESHFQLLGQGLVGWCLVPSCPGREGSLLWRHCSLSQPWAGLFLQAPIPRARNPAWAHRDNICCTCSWLGMPSASRLSVVIMLPLGSLFSAGWGCLDFYILKRGTLGPT